MKYIRTYESYKAQRKEVIEEPVNEEFFGFLGKLFGKIKERINKTKGGKEVDAIYQKYLKVISDQITKLGITDLNIMGQEAAKDEKPGAKDDAKAKVLKELLNKQKAKIQQIIEDTKKLAKTEMDNVLTKMGGAAKNPQLQMIIQSKQAQFGIDILNAEVAAYKKVGDVASADTLQKEADAKTKEMNDKMKDFDTAKPVEYKEGDNVIYLLKDKKREDWDKLTPDEKKKPTEGKAKDLVGVHKILKVDGDKFTLDDGKGGKIEKTGAEILGPAEGGGDVGEIKPGQSVVYKRDKFDEKEWAKITDEDKKKPEEGKMKELQDKEMIGIKKVKELKGDEISFEDADFKKKKEDILSVVEGGGEEGGEEELKKTMDELKKDKEAMKKVTNVAKIFQEPDKNKDKIAEIEKVLKAGEEGK